jgi:epoxyqueuosine reductase
MTPSEKIREMARDSGWDAAGIASARPDPDGARLAAWLRDGCHADMRWMIRRPDARAAPPTVWRETRSILCLANSYFTEAPPADVWDDPGRGRIARYAWGPDYHRVLKDRMQRLAERIRGEFGASAVCRRVVDTAPLLERSRAREAGLGFIGKNTCLILPSLGSMAFLCEILLTLDLEPDIEPPRERCGRCARCLTACPTGALTEPFRLDARRCISYHTIENSGEIPPSVAETLGSWIFGCDDCQTACPWVLRFSRPARDSFLSFDPDRFAPRLETALRLDEAAFRTMYASTPVIRAGRDGFVRNAAIAAGNSGDPSFIKGLQRLYEESDSPVVQHAATWAVRRLRSRDASRPSVPC